MAKEKEKATSPNGPKLSDGNELLTSKQVAEILLLSETTITHRKAGTWRIPYVELGDGERKRKRFRLEDVEQFIRAQRERSVFRIESRKRQAS